MNNELKVYHKILFLELRPWTNRDIPETKFKELLIAQDKEHYSFQPCYEVIFLKPLTSKRKYYYALIENESVRYLNNFHSIISGALNDKEKSYWVQTTLSKVLSQKLKETAKIINENQYSFEYLEATNQTIDRKIVDEVYILHYLKCQLLRLYMEIQEAYNQFLKDDALTESELLQIYFLNSATEKTCLVAATKIKLPTPASQIIENPASNSIKVLKNDFRVSKKGILSYDTIIKNPQRFAQFEEQLFVQGYIDENYNFLGKHNQKQELSAVYHQLIKKGYFSPRTYNPQKDIKQVDIRKFLDHRYNSDVDRQFRNWSNNSDELANYIDSQAWLDSLPTS